MNKPPETVNKSEPSMNDLKIALKESLHLQRHYAHLLNMWDGGERHEFKSAEEWISRLRETGTLPKCE